MARQPKPAIVWLCAALIDGQAYLFDARLGLAIPGPDGQGVATLNQALADPAILERMNFPASRLMEPAGPRSWPARPGSAS